MILRRESGGESSPITRDATKEAPEKSFNVRKKKNTLTFRNINKKRKGKGVPNRRRKEDHPGEKLVGKKNGGL